ncbi:IS3 family transposase (plasmid) [Streptomyces goshikiensis]|uniref:IS3 family transposase n=1 Tax=Streptomyces goshikiensis TaxID=1942 RepID=UPI002F912957|nr:IS3 family transposase [Streptomyces goshikiensis]
MTALLDEHPRLGVEPVLRELSVPASTYYRWRRAEKEPCERLRRDAELTDRIRQVHNESGGIYGSPRVHAVLKREGTRVGRKRVERLMRQAGLAGISPRRDKGFTRRDPNAELAPDLVERDFTATGPNRLWVTDLTMIATLEGPLWLSAIRDAFSRRVVAWETSARADADLVLTTLEYAPPTSGDLAAGAHQLHRGGLPHRRQRHIVLAGLIALLHVLLDLRHGTPRRLHSRRPWGRRAGRTVHLEQFGCTRRAGVVGSAGEGSLWL